MPENENLCVGCEDNCCDQFKLFWSMEEIESLIQKYPFLSVLGSDIGLFGKEEKVYRVMECSRLQDDGSCEDYPNNRPAFCENTGVKNRPATNCKFNDLVRNKK